MGGNWSSPCKQGRPFAGCVQLPVLGALLETRPKVPGAKEGRVVLWAPGSHTSLCTFEPGLVRRKLSREGLAFRQASSFSTSRHQGRPRTEGRSSRAELEARALHGAPEPAQQRPKKTQEV